MTHKQFEKLLRKAQKASMKAETMLGIPNDIARQEGRAEGLWEAVRILREDPSR